MRVHLLCCIALVAGCSDDANDSGNDNGSGNGSDNGSDDAPETQAIARGNTRGEALVGQASGELTGSSDGDAMAKAADIVATINAGEIAQADFVLAMTSNTDVSDLASEIKVDHEVNNEALQEMLQAHGLSPVDSAVASTLQGETDMALAELQAAASGDLDAFYVEMQVAMHQEASVILDVLRDYLTTEEFRDFLSDTRDAIDTHRQHAIDVLRDLQ